MNELDAVGWAVRLAKRIEGMHALGVTHGSVSPACVLLEGRDRTARAQLLDVRKSSASLACQSPERVRGGGLSQADDTWALACTLYAALTGNAPFQGADDDEVKQKILASSPSPLAVFDVGDDDLQRILDDAFARDLDRRTTSVAALRAALEEWHPDPNVGALPAVEDEGAAGAEDEDEEDERTIMRSPADATPARLPAAPFGFPHVAPPAAPPPRASSPGSAPGLSPLLAARPGAAARAVPPAGASSPGFPPPGALPPGQRGASPADEDDDEEDARTVMRTVPEHLASALGGGASRSGAFAAVAPGRSGAFPAAGLSPEGPHGALDDDEATRMLPAPAFHDSSDDDDDDEQKTLMRSSLPPDEVAARPLPAAGARPGPQDAPSKVVPFPGGPAAAPWGAAPVAPPPGAAASPATEPAFPPPAASPFAGPPAPLAAPAVAGAAPVALAGAAATAPVPASPPRRLAIWITLAALLLAAAATYLVLRMT